MWLNGLCCGGGGLCGTGDGILKKSGQCCRSEPTEQEELNGSSTGLPVEECGVPDPPAAVKFGPKCVVERDPTATGSHVVMGCTPSILSNSSGDGGGAGSTRDISNQQQRKDSGGLHGAANVCVGTGSDSNGANNNKLVGHPALNNQTQMLGPGGPFIRKDPCGGSGSAGEMECIKKDSIVSITGLGHVSVVSNVLRRPTVGSKSLA
ncbi:uncharacterized protein LOC129719635 [Wyeomyia smithii]|uniref:uncharacterized protein LOC129719635 n=1 Tax=Wyeomyia smithii TaxID=174621 RepID=UPI002467C74C|nr:uncharacterized protein LOC129719635 [Wyeomyia smithii]